MIGPGYWTTGITIERHTPGVGWSVSLQFFDNGFCQDGSTEGVLRARYIVPVSGLGEAVETLKRDAERLGIRFGVSTQSPTVYVHGDVADLQPFANVLASRLGWEPCYRPHAQVAA